MRLTLRRASLRRLPLRRASLRRLLPRRASLKKLLPRRASPTKKPNRKHQQKTSLPRVRRKVKLEVRMVEL